MQKKIISIVSNNYWTLYKFRYDIICEFSELGYRINLIAGKDKYHSKFTDTNIIKHFIPIKERGSNVFDEIKLFIVLLKLYKKIKPDLIFHFTIKPNLYGSLISRILKIKSISMITGLGHVFIKNNFFLKKFIIYFLRFALKDVLEIWFTNKHDEDYFKSLKIIKDQNTQIVPGAGAVFGIKNYNPYHDSKKKNFVMISRLLKEKGVLEFLSAAHFFKDDASLNFILVGSHDKKNHDYVDIKKLNEFTSEKIITYYDFQDNIMEIFNQTSCIVHPSYREGMSTILLEAASLRIPIITTKVPGCIDIVCDESFGLLCNAGDSMALISSIKKFLLLNKTEIESMTEKTFTHVRNKFNREDILNTYESSLKYLK
tara:strand:- start:157 stop:1269 length:1113 start_codon:yes stop_codon:yes gene_type:complete